MELPQPLSTLATAFDDFLRDSQINWKLAHHAAHLGPETWLAMELPLLVNSQLIPNLSGWRAILERGKVDCALLPPDNTFSKIAIELKIVDRWYWEKAWMEAYLDLSGKPSKNNNAKGKPPADISVCFVFRPMCQGKEKNHPTTITKWNQWFSSLPKAAPQVFTPVTGKPNFWALHVSEPIELVWEHPVHERWPQGYKAELSVLWVKRGTTESSDW